MMSHRWRVMIFGFLLVAGGLLVGAATPAEAQHHGHHRGYGHVYRGAPAYRSGYRFNYSYAPSYGYYYPNYGYGYGYGLNLGLGYGGGYYSSGYYGLSNRYPLYRGYSKRRGHAPVHLRGHRR